MITFGVNQLVAHAVGDYVFQSDWMATEKRNSFHVAMIHALTYSIPFLFISGLSFAGWGMIVLTHALIDHFALAKYVAFSKNFIAPPSHWPKWENCKGNGYDASRPAWLTTWLFIITDNIMHVLCNAVALSL